MAQGGHPEGTDGSDDALAQAEQESGILDTSDGETTDPVGEKPESTEEAEGGDSGAEPELLSDDGYEEKPESTEEAEGS